jgi:hypothetical protein
MNELRPKTTAAKVSELWDDVKTKEYDLEKKENVFQWNKQQACRKNV